MNTKTAEKLNELRNAAVPVTHNARGHILGPVPPSLWESIGQAEQAANPEMVRREIIAAAKEKREANVNAPDWGNSYWAGQISASNSIPWAATKARWEIARPVIDALIATHNVASTNAYETYRIACEQGVAVPPQVK